MALAQSSEATSNVNDIKSRAPVGFSCKPTGHKRNRVGLSWTGWRPFSSIDDFQSAVLSMDRTEAETEHTSAENVEDFDFTNFPALKSSFFENYERPNEMLVPKKRVNWQTKVKSFGADKKLTLDSIPKPRGRTYDFGLGSSAAKPPPLEAGARPQGGFDINISFNKQEVGTCESSVLPQRQSCLPSKIFVTNKLSESQMSSHVSEVQDSQMIDDRDFQIHENRDFQTTEESVLDHEQDLLWDPYNVGDEQLKSISKETSRWCSCGTPMNDFIAWHCEFWGCHLGAEAVAMDASVLEIGPSLFKLVSFKVAVLMRDIT
ncbi:hypothetical protein GOP47_0007494 [Adiantum capillus-veneris]|uniref:Uncharacterized protein n=1 Tax=Adiantum capillus-veneris TaxID=13818 RepID=A0A9D4V0U0_ADICA|nr:hypothetical protein GOP47_0007494 [Adiantum capillus-veneris]